MKQMIVVERKFIAELDTNQNLALDELIEKEVGTEPVNTGAISEVRDMWFEVDGPVDIKELEGRIKRALPHTVEIKVILEGELKEEV